MFPARSNWERTRTIAMAATATTKFLRTATSLLLVLRHRTTEISLPTTYTLTRRFCSTSAGAEASDFDVQGVHPWQEWDGFLEKLKEKGYFDRTLSRGEEEETFHGRDNGELRLTSPSSYTRAKVACLGFARERPDLLRLLPKEDIQVVVGCGCPNLLRKSVNSAKRLRAYVKLDEGDVCCSCTLRGTCDRAYVMVKKEEGIARTVDIVRLLLQYATEPIAVGSGEKPPLNEHVEESVRKLFKELIKLSDTQPDPEIINAMFRRQVQVVSSQDGKVLESKQYQNTEMKKGDWICSQCNFMNYARNVLCRQCKGDRTKKVSFDNPEPKRDSLQSPEMKRGDWICQRCNYLNYARNVQCLQCKEVAPRRSFDVPEMKKGDWNCPRCQFMNFARNMACRQCQESRPKRELEPGEWECPRCGFLNFRRNDSCLKCKCDRRRDESAPYDDDGVWRRSELSTAASEL